MQFCTQKDKRILWNFNLGVLSSWLIYITSTYMVYCINLFTEGLWSPTKDARGQARYATSNEGRLKSWGLLDPYLGILIISQKSYLVRLWVRLLNQVLISQNSSSVVNVFGLFWHISGSRSRILVNSVPFERVLHAASISFPPQRGLSLKISRSRHAFWVVARMQFSIRPYTFTWNFTKPSIANIFSKKIKISGKRKSLHRLEISRK
jgi:hypothetical protein